MAESAVKQWPSVAVVGFGGVGAYYGGMLARAGAPVTVLGRPGSRSAHLEAVAREGLRMRTLTFEETVRVAVAGDPSALRGAELILFCVKSVDTTAAAAGIAGHLAPGALVLDLQNGFDNPLKLREAGIDPIPAVVYVASAVERPGELVHRGRGDLVIGHRDRTGDVARAAAWLEAAGIPCRVSDNVEAELWLKLILNSMANATSALTGATYRTLAEFGPAWEVARDVAREGVEVARRDGYVLDAGKVITLGVRVCRDVGAATSSTQQDLAAGRPTEIDSLNGYIARRGKELGVPTPVNRALWALVRLREKTEGIAAPGRTAQDEEEKGP